MKRSILIFLVFSFLIMTGKAEIIVDFDDASTFNKIEMYDSWENSPFHTGQLNGNWKLVKNPVVMADTVSNVVLGSQRSRHASNLFGVKIDLAAPFELSPQIQYIRLKLLRPTDGRVELIGLGSRKERLGQNPFTEQFCQESINSVPSGEWAEAVFPVNGADGVVIRSLVVIPDCESPHNLKKDFLFYVDDIELVPSL